MVAAFSEGGIKLADVDELLGVSEWEETSALFDALAANDGAPACGWWAGSSTKVAICVSS